MQLNNLPEYDILKITKYLDAESTRNLKNTCKHTNAIIESDHRSIDQVLWSPFEKNLKRKRAHILIKPMENLIQWSYTQSRNRNKPKLTKSLIKAEVDVMQKIMSIKNHKEVLPYPIPQYIRGRIRDELIKTHLKLRQMCSDRNSEHRHSPIRQLTHQCKHNPICDMENVIYKYITEPGTPQILPTYILVIINNTLILSAPKNPSRFTPEKKKRDLFTEWLIDRLYLFQDEHCPNIPGDKWPPTFNKTISEIIQAITGT